VWLGHYQVVSVGEAVEGVLQEVLRSRVKGGFHTEKGDCEGILGFLRGLGDTLEIVQILHYIVIVAIVTVLDRALGVGCLLGDYRGGYLLGLLTLETFGLHFLLVST